MDADALGDGAGETLALVAMVVGHQDVGDAVDTHLGEVVEHDAGAEVDRDGGGLRGLGARDGDALGGADDVDVAGVGHPEDPGHDLRHGSGAHDRDGIDARSP